MTLESLAIPYSSYPRSSIKLDSLEVSSFIVKNDNNIDWKTVKSFGDEWLKFNNFTDTEIEKIGNDYFDIVNESMLNKDTYVLDVGCGTGRWSKYMTNKSKFIEAIDPSDAVFAAAKLLKNHKNVRVTQASVDTIPFPDDTFDFVTSLGVLHHIPDTERAIKQCAKKLKKGGWLHIYLYYKLENKPLYYRFLFWISALARYLISLLPKTIKHFICDIIAVFIYLPLARTARIISRINSSKTLLTNWPLAYYRDKSLQIMRNDSLDRFGTPLEQRFTKKEIAEMLSNAGLIDITFSTNEPFWHVVARKKLN